MGWRQPARNDWGYRHLRVYFAKRHALGVNYATSTNDAANHPTLSSGLRFGLKLFLFGRSSQCRSRRDATRNGLRYFVEVARADEPLVLRGAIAAVGFALELAGLQLRISCHAV